jgi:hypothetical protein
MLLQNRPEAGQVVGLLLAIGTARFMRPVHA